MFLVEPGYNSELTRLGVLMMNSCLSVYSMLLIQSRVNSKTDLVITECYLNESEIVDDAKVNAEVTYSVRGVMHMINFVEKNLY